MFRPETRPDCVVPASILVTAKALCSPPEYQSRSDDQNQSYQESHAIDRYLKHEPNHKNTHHRTPPWHFSDQHGHVPGDASSDSDGRYLAVNKNRGNRFDFARSPRLTQAPPAPQRV